MRQSVKTSAQRTLHQTARVTLTQADDKPMMQEVAVEILKGEKKTGLERFQNYGFTSVPLKGKEGDDAAAEGVVVFIGGNRSHGVIVAIDDRRNRLKNLKEGEAAQYDDLGQKVHLTRDGIVIDAGDKNKKPVTIKCGESTVVITKDDITVKRGSADVKIKDGEIEAKVGSTAIYVSAGRIDLGVKNAPFKVITEGGPSEIVWAVK